MVITMLDEIYQYLINYGFSKENLRRFEEENENMYFVSLDKVKENIDFFTNKGLNKSEFINIVNISYGLRIKHIVLFLLDQRIVPLPQYWSR